MDFEAEFSDYVASLPSQWRTCSGHDCGTCRDGGHEAEMCALRMNRIANA